MAAPRMCSTMVGNVITTSATFFVFTGWNNMSLFMNAPGSMHNSTVAELGGVYDKIEAIFNDVGGKIVVNSAFSTRNCPSLIKSFDKVVNAS